MALQASQAMKNLIDLGKEHGYLTLEEISRSLSMSNMSSRSEVTELDEHARRPRHRGRRPQEGRGSPRSSRRSASPRSGARPPTSPTPSACTSPRWAACRSPDQARRKSPWPATSASARRSCAFLVLESPVTHARQDPQLWRLLIAQQEMTWPKELIRAARPQDDRRALRHAPQDEGRRRLHRQVRRSSWTACARSSKTPSLKPSPRIKMTRRASRSATSRSSPRS